MSSNDASAATTPKVVDKEDPSLPAPSPDERSPLPNSCEPPHAPPSVAAGAVATAPPPANALISIRILNDLPHLLAGQKVGYQELTTMLHLEAPILESLEERRQGITLTAVIDVSGSMRGQKLRLVQQSLQLMVSQLSANDSFGIVTFASDINEPLPMQKMDSNAKENAERIIDAMRATSCTNLSGGLFAGINQACGLTFVPGPPVPRPSAMPVSLPPANAPPQPKTSSSSFLNSFASLFGSKKKEKPQHVDATLRPSDVPPPAERTRAEASSAAPTAVLLFTDGQANEGICDRSELFAALRRRLTDAPHVVVHTFGFGTDHDVLLLQGIAEQSQGSYYFIKDSTVLKESFADCLGGLVSVVATNLSLKMTVLNDDVCEVAQVMTKYPMVVSGRTRSIAIKDLYSGESRDVPVALKVRTEGVSSGSSLPLVAWTLEYHSTIDERAHTERCESLIPLEAAAFAGTPNVTVDEQRNRFLAALALEEARKAAEAHDFASAQQAIRNYQEKAQHSASAQTGYSLNLRQEMEAMMDAVQDEQRYSAEGGRGMNQVMMRHQQQRCNDARESADAMYQTSWKKEMKRKTKS